MLRLDMIWGSKNTYCHSVDLQHAMCGTSKGELMSAGSTCTCMLPPSGLAPPPMHSGKVHAGAP